MKLQQDLKVTQALLRAITDGVGSDNVHRVLNLHN